MKGVAGSIDHAQSQQRDGNLPDGAHQKWPRSLLAQLAQIGTETNACERQQKSPPGEVSERRSLPFIEKPHRSQQRDHQKSEDKLRKFLPQKCGLSCESFRLPLRRPVDRVP